jgi:6-phosphofructokinase
MYRIYRGYQGNEGDFKEMGPRSVNNIVNKGGTVLKSARSLEFKTQGRLNTRTSCESRDRCIGSYWR